jgi:uncharacterized SAM-binding protein YcdF (DUF218 family)
LSHTLALATALLLALAADARAGALGDWLAREDPLAPCSVLVVLNGEHPARADEAARLYRAGTAPEIWLTGDPASADEKSDVGTRSNRARLASLGVPDAAIRLIPGTARGTRSELEAIAAALQARALPCAVLVTSPRHVRRVRVTWDRAVGDVPRAIVRGAPQGTHANGWRGVATEVALTVLAWIGLR